MKLLVVGATGSIGRLAVEEAIRQGHTVRALVRDTKKARRLSAGTDVVVGDLTHVETLAAAVDGVDAIVFTHGSDWKRRGERLVRVTGLPYTIVRPGWFDYNKPDEHRLAFLQGDRRHAGDSSDGVIARCQIAEVLVASLTSDGALRKSFELVATRGEAQDDLDSEFARLDADPPGTLDAVHDATNMPLEGEAQRVREDLQAVKTSAR
jgi:uncharacterized protein YbjT (DUF2867 family)